jgi:ABC-type branched-subunit amino acid transport system ATPase component
MDKSKEDQEVHTMLEQLEILHLARANVSGITPVARRLVEVGRTLIAKPKLVLFDEVMAGFNESETAKLIDIIRGYRCRGVTFCIIGHTMRAIMDISDHIIVMHEGTKYVEGAPGEIQKSVAVRDIYFGE